MSWQKIKLNIPKSYTPIERKAIAQEVIEFIIARTKQGKDKNNKTFSGYSDQYKKSLDYKIAGKPKSGRPVDLTLSGEMLNSIELLNDSKGSLVIGFDKSDTELNDKVEGNRLGTYGSTTPIRGKKRDFLGITQEDLKKILKNYPSRNRDESIAQARDNLKDAIEAENIVKGIDFTLEDLED
jgi:hypothetical protein